MNTKLKTLFALTITSMMLFGCKASEIETSIKSKDLRKAIAGEQVSVEFEATLTLLAENTGETKSQIKAIENVFEKYLSLEEFDVTAGDVGFNIKLEGELPLVYSPDATASKSVKSPWAMIISDNRDGGSLSGFSYKLIFSTSSQFDAFSGELQKINFLLSPDERQPMKFKLKNTGKDKLRIFTGGVEVGGETKVVYETDVEKRVSLTMKSGVYDNTAQIIYFSLK